MGDHRKIRRLMESTENEEELTSAAALTSYGGFAKDWRYDHE